MPKYFAISLFFISVLLFSKCNSDIPNTRTLKLSHEVDSLINDTTSIVPIVDSQKVEIRIAKTDTSVINLLAALSFNWRLIKPTLSEEAMRLSKILNYPYGICRANIGLGFNYMRNSNFTAADSMYDIALSDATKYNFLDLQSQTLISKGDLLRLQSMNDSALLYVERGLSIARKINDKSKIGQAQNVKGEIYRNKSQFLEATICLEEALAISKETNNKQRMSGCLSTLSSFYRTQDNFPKALEYSFQSLAIAQSIHDKRNEATCYNVIGAIYFKQKNYDKALNYFLRALKLGQENKDNIRITNAYLSIGSVYEEKKDYTYALNYYNKGKTLAEETDNKDYLSYSLGAIGSVYRILENFEEAQRMNSEALAIARITGNSSYIATDLCNQAKDFLQLDDKNSAKKSAQESLALGYESSQIENIRDASEILYKIYDTLGDYKNAYKMHKVYTTMKDSITNIDQVKKFAAVEFKGKEDIYKSDKLKSDEALKSEKLIRNGFVMGSMLFAILLVIILFSLVKNKKAKKIIEKQKIEVEHQKHEVEEKQKEIIESITYAKRLQEAILPPQEFVDKHTPDNFILYKPKDLVAGDFYWAEKLNDLFFIAAADSTGHGVPGAMVSVVCSNALNRSVKEFNLTTTGEILDKTRELVLETFEKSVSEVKDGMDVSLLCIDHKNKQIFWSGANNPLWYINNNELHEIKADKQPIGKTEYPKPFTTHHISYEARTTFYLFTDGFADQFGGPKGKKFKYKPFGDLLLSNNHLPLKQQSNLINNAFEDWKDNLEQVDDVCIVGIRI